MPTLPPTFLKSTLYTNELFGNIFVQGNIKSGSITANVIYGNVVGSNIVANTIYGNVSATNIVAQNIYGNLTANTWTPGNVTNLNITGNMTAGYFIGNGSQLTGIATSTLPGSANLDITGNVIGAYANVTTLIGTAGNIGNVRMMGGNVEISGQVTATGNVSAEYFLGNGALLTGIEQYVLPSEITADVLGNVTATGNVSAEYFLGNGALLTGIEQYVLPSEITADVLGNVTATGNVSAEYFLGNGALLTGIEQYVLPSEITADVLGNVTATGNVSAEYFLGNGALLTGIEQYVLPSEITADVFGNVTATGNVEAVLFIGNGALLTGIEQYVLPSEITADVFGNVTATGNVEAALFIGNGALLTGIEQYVLPSEITADVFGNVTATGNVEAALFIGNGALLTGIEQYVLPSQITADVLGNVTATGNVEAVYFLGNGSQLTGIEQYVLPSQITADVLGNVTATGNVEAVYFLGNGSQLTGIEQYVLPSQITADVLGNVTATGNVEAVYFLGNGSQLTGIEQYVLPSEITADVLGNVTATGNVEAVYFLGNGSQLTGIEQYVLPGSANINITGNIIGAYANVATLIGTTGNVGNVRMAGGNIDVSGQVNALGNIAAPFFVGNGSLLTGILSSSPLPARYLSAGRTTDQTSAGAWANVNIILDTVRASSGITYNTSTGVFTLEGGVTYRITAQLNWSSAAAYAFTYRLVNSTTGAQIGPYAEAFSMSSGASGTNNPSAPVLDIIVTPSTTTDYRLRMATSTTALEGERLRADTGTFLTIVGLGSGFTSGLPSTGNIDISGNVIGSYANVTTLIGTTGNVGNVRMVGGNVAVSGQINTLGNVVAPFFIGNGSQLTGLLSGLPSTGNIDITGNHIGSYANVTTLIGTTGNVGNVRMVGGNVAVSGQVNALGNVVASFFIGNGSQLTGITPPARYLSAGRSSNQTIGSGTWSNVNVIMNSVSESSGITYNSTTGVITLEGGVTYRITAQLGWSASVAYTYGFRLVNSTTGVQIGPDAQTSAPTSSFTNGPGPLLDIILTPSTTTDYRLRMSTFVTASTSEQLRSDSGTFLNIVGMGSGFTSGLPSTGNIDIRGNAIGAYANVDSVLANSAIITSAGNANVLTVAGTTTNTTGSLIQATSLRGNNAGYSLLRLDNIGGRLLDVNGNGEMALTSATSNADIMSISTRFGSFMGNAINIVVPRLSFTDYSFINCRNTNGQLFNVDGRGMVTATSVVNSNVLVLNASNSSGTTYTADVLRIQSSSTGTGFNMISARNSGGNVFRVNGSGAVFGVGAYNTSGADYAEMFEWEDGNTNDEDRRGVTVVKGNNGVIRIATGLDNPAAVFGVVSSNPSIVGDARWNEWSGRYLRDRFGTKLSNTLYYIANVSNENERVRCGINDTPPDGYEKVIGSEFVENPAYDPNVAYVSREDRKEWATVGLIGKLMVLPDQVVNPNWILFRNISHPDGDVLEYIVK
jgi:hypothetical protein